MHCSLTKQVIANLKVYLKYKNASDKLFLYFNVMEIILKSE